MLRAADQQDSRTSALEVLLLGGRPIGEPVAAYGPFVMNTRAELAQAVEDFQAGRLGVVPDGALMPHRIDSTAACRLGDVVQAHGRHQVPERSRRVGSAAMGDESDDDPAPCS